MKKGDRVRIWDRQIYSLGPFEATIEQVLDQCDTIAVHASLPVYGRMAYVTVFARQCEVIKGLNDQDSYRSHGNGD